MKERCEIVTITIDDLCLNATDPATLFPPPPITDHEAREILWRLSELNFRFELHALNKCAGPPGCDEFNATRLSALLCTSLRYKQLTWILAGKVFALVTGSLVYPPSFDLQLS